MNIIKVSVIEDHDSYREHLAALISGAPGFACTGTHPNAEKALEALPFEKPDAVLLDLELPRMSGIDLIAELKSRLPGLEILVLTIHDDPKEIFAALEAGATGYLLKPVAPARILEAIAEVHSGGSPMSAQIARLVVRTFHARGQSRHELENLTAREAEVLDYLSKGYNYQEIATNLGIAVRTVSTHLHNIYEKLHVHSGAQAVARYRGQRQ